MKVLGVVCSPRKKGNSEILMRETLKSAQENGAEVEFWTVAGKDLKPCIACDKCLKTGRCTTDDDMQELYTKMETADGIILATPTYVWNVSAQAKIIMDRCRALHPQRRLRDKVGAVLVTQTRGGASGCFHAFWAFCHVHRMVASGGAFGFGRERGAVKKDERAMAEAKAVGRVVVRNILRSQQINREASIEKPMAMPDKYNEQTLAGIDARPKVKKGTGVHSG